MRLAFHADARGDAGAVVKIVVTVEIGYDSSIRAIPLVCRVAIHALGPHTAHMKPPDLRRIGWAIGGTERNSDVDLEAPIRDQAHILK